MYLAKSVGFQKQSSIKTTSLLGRFANTNWRGFPVVPRCGRFIYLRNWGLAFPDPLGKPQRFGEPMNFEIFCAR